MGEGTYTAQAVWNFDEAQLKALYELKLNVIESFGDLDLDRTYWLLRSMWRERDRLPYTTLKNSWNN